MEVCKIWMLNGIAHGDALIWVEAQHFLQKVDCHWCRMWYLVFPPYLLLFGHPLHVVKCVLVVHERQVLVCGKPNDLDNFIKLLHVVMPLEECGLHHELTEDAAD